VPAAMIVQLTPLVGPIRAELIAVIAWPTLLFAAALFLISAIARRFDQASARTALIVAAIGYPVTTLFLPGRIDHHGLQIVLMLVMVRALIARPGHASGAIIGLAGCASIVIGLETAPFVLAAGVLVWIGWAAGRASGQLLSFGLTFGLGLAFSSIVFSPDVWAYPACDGFTRSAWESAQIAAFAPVILGVAGPMMASPRHRIAASGLVGLATIAMLFPIARGCMSPYGAVDPVLARIWLGNVGEAQPLLAASPAVAVGYAGLLIVGLIASLWCAHRRPSTAWAVLIAFQLVSLALTVVQLRGAYGGAILAAPALAALITAARARGTPWLAGAWIGSAGMLYPIAAQAFTPAAGAPPRDEAKQLVDCTSPAMMSALAALPVGTVIAPIDVGAYAIAATRHRLIAAPYHRNNAGNAAMYRFYQSAPDAALAIAHDLRADYVLICPGSFGELGDAVTRDTLIGGLNAGERPGWLHAIGRSGPAAQIFRVEAGLSSRPKAL